MVSIAVTVVIAIFGTTLSCLNTAVRISYAMAQDEEMPEITKQLREIAERRRER